MHIESEIDIDMLKQIRSRLRLFANRGRCFYESEMEKMCDLTTFGLF